MQIPKLQPVGSDLERVESVKQQVQQDPPSTNLGRIILANEMILAAINRLLLVCATEMEPIIRSKVSELSETLGEQRLSLQLLRLLDRVGGSKSDAAEQLRVWLDEYEKY